MLRSDWPFSQQKTTDNQDNAFPLHTPSSGKQIKSNSAKPKFKEQDKTRGMQSMRAELIVKASTPQSWALLWSRARTGSGGRKGEKEILGSEHAFAGRHTYIDKIKAGALMHASKRVTCL